MLLAKQNKKKILWGRYGRENRQAACERYMKKHSKIKEEHQVLKEKMTKLGLPKAISYTTNEQAISKD